MYYGVFSCEETYIGEKLEMWKPYGTQAQIQRLKGVIQTD